MPAPLHLGPDKTLLFIGDSITDCNRRQSPDGLGDGYVRLIHDYLLAKAPAEAPKVINVGISGNQVTDLAARWDDDVIAHAPHAVSVKIGINDVWRQLDGKAPGTLVEDYTRIYDGLLTQLSAKMPGVQIVLCEPSVISPPQPAHGNEMLLPYVAAVNELAIKHNAILVPLHDACLSAERQRADVSWWPDGVHPSPTGHMLLARTWLVATGFL